MEESNNHLEIVLMEVVFYCLARSLSDCLYIELYLDNADSRLEWLSAYYGYYFQSTPGQMIVSKGLIYPTHDQWGICLWL